MARGSNTSGSLLCGSRARVPEGLSKPSLRHTFSISRRIAPEVCWKLFALDGQRAQGRPGARCTRGLVCNVHKECAHEHTGPAESIRPSLRNGFTAYNVLSPENGSFASVAPREAVASRCIDASTAASGPHVFAVRISAVRQGASASTAPCPAFRDDRERPSWWGRMDGVVALICASGKAKYFSIRGLTRIL